MRFRSFLVTVCVSLLLTGLLVNSALAIPAFSRLYKTECSTCHVIFPERNEFGDAFEKNSFVWPGKLPAQSQVKPDMTPEQKKQAEAMYLSGLPEVLPVALMGQIESVYNSDDDPKLDLVAETELEMFAAGNFRQLAGFWGEYKLSSSSIGDVSVQFRHVANTPLNIKVGKFKPKLSLWKSNDRSSLKGFGHNSMAIGSNPFRISRRQGAVEINSVVTPRLFLAAGVTDGTDGGNDDAQDTKEYYGHLSFRVGGIDFLGKEPEVDLDKDSIWDFLALTFGGFGYSGSDAAGSNDFYRAGLESEILYKRFKMRLSGTFGHDDDTDGLGNEAEARFYLAQAQYLIGSNLIPAFRFEYQDVDTDGITRRYIPSVTYAVLQNLRLALEYVHTETPSVTEKEAAFNIAFSF